jgi:hypothetical protein
MALHGGVFHNYYHRSTGWVEALHALCSVVRAVVCCGGAAFVRTSWQRIEPSIYHPSLSDPYSRQKHCPLLSVCNQVPAIAVTHIICSNLPDAKVKHLQKERSPTPIVRPEWIVDSLQAGAVLPVRATAGAWRCSWAHYLGLLQACQHVGSLLNALCVLC